MLPTPSTSHVSYDSIYEPAEDSYLFLDTLSSPPETDWLKTHFTPLSIQEKPNVCQRPRPTPTPLVVELGPGSGVIIAFLTAHAHTIFGTDILSLSIDVNPLACLATRTTVEKALDETNPSSLETSNGSNTVPVQEPAKNNSIYLSSLQADLTTPILHNQVDILIFNPPYVPTESVPSFPPRATASETSLTNTKPTFDESSHLLSLSYAGGQDGMEVTNRVLAQIPETLSQRGVAYILFCRGNKPEEVKARIRAWEGGWCAETVGNSGKKAGWERLEIVRIWRGRNGS